MTKKKKSEFEQKYGICEESFIEACNKITKKLSYKFKFGYHDVDDMKQQATIFALEALDRYDKSRPLENFLWTHVRNRLFNYKRDNYQRPDKPCATCQLLDHNLKKSVSGCQKYENKMECELYKQWSDRNDRKKNLVQSSVQIDEEKTSNNLDYFDMLSNNEIIEFLDQNLNYEYREIYLRLKNGDKVLSQDLNKFKKEIARILNHDKDT